MNRHEESQPEEAMQALLMEESAPLPPELEARLRARLGTLRARIEGAPAPVREREGWIMLLMRSFRRGSVRWATIAALVIVGLVVGYATIGGGPSNASYAAVAERLHKAVTASFHMRILGVPGAEEMTVEVYRKEPDKLRIEMKGGPVETVSIVSGSGKQVLSLIPASKQAVLFGLGDWLEQKQANNYWAALDEIQNLPARADEAMFGELDGRRMRIYLIAGEQDEKYLWIDDKTGELARFVVTYPRDAHEGRVEMDDFKINQPLDDALFSMTPPEGYTLANLPAGMPDLTSANESNLLDYLKISVEGTGTFPSIVDPARPVEMSQVMAAVVRPYLMKLAKEGKVKDEMDAMQKAMQYSLSIAFVAQLPPESDFHYAGADLKPGNAADWVCWWKPKGAADYRVIHGDLSVSDETAETVAAHGSDGSPGEAQR